MLKMKNNNNLSDTKDNLSGEIVSFKVQDILNYQISTMYKGEEYDTLDNFTILDLLKMISSKTPILVDGYMDYDCSQQQVILVHFWNNKEHFTKSEVWKYVNEIGLVPTFVFNDVIPNTYLKNLETDQETMFSFAYVLNQPILDERVIERISDNLMKNVFSKYHGYIECQHPQNFVIENNITELYISNNVYVPVEGETSYGD